jgi:hypothetical protein
MRNSDNRVIHGRYKLRLTVDSERNNLLRSNPAPNLKEKLTLHFRAAKDTSESMAVINPAVLVNDTGTWLGFDLVSVHGFSG